MAGEVRNVSGRLLLGPSDQLAGVQGRLDVNILEVTMGEPDLDSNVHNNVEFLQAKSFPQSSYEIRSITSAAKTLKPGEPAPVTLHGLFALKGVVVPMDVAAQMKLGKDGAANSLTLEGSFAIEQLRERFHIAGPGAENDPAGDRLLLDFQIQFGRAPQ